MFRPPSTFCKVVRLLLAHVCRNQVRMLKNVLCKYDSSTEAVRAQKEVQSRRRSARRGAPILDGV